MPRPKGSKNKKKLIASAPIDELIAQRVEAKTALEEEFNAIKSSMEEQATQARSIKSRLKRIDKELGQLNEQKEAADKAAAVAAAKEAVQGKVDQLLADGRSLEDIMNMLG